MAQNRKAAIADTFEETQRLIEEGRAPAISEIMSAYSCGNEFLDEGQALLTDAEQKHQRVQKELGEAAGVAAQLDEEEERGREIYMGHVKLSRTEFENEPEMLIKLSLVGRRKEDTPGWLRQADDYYTTAQGDEVARQRLMRVNVHEGDLAHGAGSVERVRSLQVQLQRERAELYQARLDRDAALDKLAAWVSRYKAIARVALARHPGLLQQLGL